MPIQLVCSARRCLPQSFSLLVLEKRLAMELISRTMQDMQTHENEISSDVSATDSSTVGSNLNK